MNLQSRRLTAALAPFMSLLIAQGACAGTADLSALSTADHHDQFIVHLHDDLRNTNALAQVKGVLAKVDEPVRRTAVSAERQLATGAVVVRVARPLDAAQAAHLMQTLAQDPQVAWVEVDRLLQPTLNPDDPQLSQQWAFGTSPASLNVRPAWDVTTGTGQVVAIIDTGSTRHPELDANTLSGYDFISSPSTAGDGNGRDADPADEGDGGSSGGSSWHGTHVAGTVAALTNNGRGVAGTAFGARLFHARVLGKGGGRTSDIADAIVWSAGGQVPGIPANPNPASVLNLSLGGRGSCDRASQAAIDDATRRGATVVVAAGNGSRDVAGYTPASCRGVVAVAATDAKGGRAGFSNYGRGITLSAPGVGILSTLNDGRSRPGNPSYATYNGTSMAAPHVAGVAALIRAAAGRELPSEQVTQILQKTARPLPGSCPQGCGAGIADAAAAVRTAAALTELPPTP